MLKRITRILPFLIVTILCIGGVELFCDIAERYFTLPASASAEKSSSVSERGQNEKVLGHRDYSVIVRRNLFKSYKKAPEPIVEDEKTNPLEGLEGDTIGPGPAWHGFRFQPKQEGRDHGKEKAKAGNILRRRRDPGR